MRSITVSFKTLIYKEFQKKLNSFVPEIQITNDQSEITRDITIYSEYIDLARNGYFYKEPKKYFLLQVTSTHCRCVVVIQYLQQQTHLVTVFIFCRHSYFQKICHLMYISVLQFWKKFLISLFGKHGCKSVTTSPYSDEIFRG